MNPASENRTDNLMDKIFRMHYEGKEGYKASKLEIVKQEDLKPADNSVIRIVCMSDTHSTTGEITFPIPDGDIFLHSGDFTRLGRVSEVEEFNEFLGRLPHKHKIVIAGNHEVTFDVRTRGGRYHEETDHPDLDVIKERLTNCVYLEDSSITILGIKFYGVPWQPSHGHGGAFNLDRNSPEIRSIWSAIPGDTDVLMTHGPPLGFLDECIDGRDRAGCEDMAKEVVGRVRPRYHVFGHIHEGYGMCTNGHTIFVNASTCAPGGDKTPTNHPIVIDYPKKNEKELTKSDLILLCGNLM